MDLIQKDKLILRLLIWKQSKKSCTVSWLKRILSTKANFLFNTHFQLFFRDCHNLTTIISDNYELGLIFH